MSQNSISHSLSKRLLWNLKIPTLNLHAPAVSSATSDSDIVLGQEFSNTIRLTRMSGESIELDQRRIKIRETRNGLMALSYIAPVFDIMDLEDFFDDVLSSEKLDMDIGDTGDFRVSYRGMIEGKNKNFPQNLDHKIILLQEPVCPDSIMDVQLKGFSKFKPRGKIS